MKRAQRLSNNVFAATVDVRAGECERHHLYANKPAVRRGARAHVRAWKRGELRCHKCAAGIPPNLFECAGHWHWGHRRKNITVNDNEQSEQPDSLRDSGRHRA